MITFQMNNGALEIRRGDEVIHKISAGDFFCEVGTADTSFSMNRGSFKISEEVLDKRALYIREIKIKENWTTLYLTEGRVRLQTEYGGERLKVSFLGLSIYDKLWFRIPALPWEAVFGTGETFSEFNLRGQSTTVWVSEHINAKQVATKLVKNFLHIGKPEQRKKFHKYASYYVQPTFLSSRKYFFHADATSISRFDFTNVREHLIEINELSPIYFGFGKTYEDVLANLTDLIGRQPTLPDWVFDGEILGIQGGTEIMDQKVHTALEHGMKVAGVWIQDWEGRRVTAVGKQLFWNWEWDKELYPDLDKRIAQYGEKGIRILGYCNPFLAVEKPLYQIAADKGYCVKDKDGDDYLVTITTFPAAMVDLTNPDAYNWIKEIIKTNMIDFGLAGWMADFGEYLPTDCVLFSGEDPVSVHNIWPTLWAKVNREALQESGMEGKLMFFTRSGYTDTVKYSTMMWNGDNHVDFTFDLGLPSVIPAMLSLTCFGFGLSHSDIGGYTTFFNLKRSEELLMRWREMNAFSPVLRGHEGLNPDLNAQFDASEAVLRHGAAMSAIHAALKPYLMEADRYNHEHGVGIVRPLFFYYNEQRAFLETHEYLLGRDILVAPVITEGAVTREVYLPDDEWIHAPSGTEFRGGVYTVSAPIGAIPVFYRKKADASVHEMFASITFPKEREIYG